MGRGGWSKHPVLARSPGPLPACLAGESAWVPDISPSSLSVLDKLRAELILCVLLIAIGVRFDYRLLIKGNAGGEALGNPCQGILTSIPGRENPPTGFDSHTCVTIPALEGSSPRPD